MKGLLRAALLGAAAVAAVECDAAKRRVNVLIVSIDTLRADHLGCHGYAPYAEPVSPHIDALARAGLDFTRCSTARGQTAPSLGSLMTGLYPSRHGVLDNGVPFRAGTRSLAQELMAAGYDARAFVGFLPGSRNGRATLGIPPDHVFDAMARHKEWAYSRCDEAAEQAFTSFVAERKDAEKPFFAWVHFFDVHQPYTPPPPYDTVFAGDYRGALRPPAGAASPEARERWFQEHVEPAMNARMVARAPLDAADAKYLVALYDGGVRATDERVGRMVAALEKAGLAGDTLVIVTADHGEELGQHNAFWFHGNSVHEPVLHIPLIVKGPGVRAGRCDALIQNVDVMPTLLEWLGAAAPAASDGVSFAALLREERSAAPRAVAWSEWQDLILGARTAERRFVFNPRGAHPKKPPYFSVPDDPGYFVDCAELYDVVADPLELRNVWDRDKEAAEALRAQVVAEFERRGFGGRGLPRDPAEPADPETAKRLLEIGYEQSDSERRDVVFDPGSCEHK